MAFTTYERIKNYIIPQISKKLSEAVPDGSETYFEQIEPDADELISSLSNRSIPTNVADSPSWIHIPAAYIYQKLASNLITGLSPEITDRIDSDYNKALKIIDENPNLDEDLNDRSSSTIGSINNLNTW